MSVRYCECVSVALVSQHSRRMRRITLPSVAYPAVLYFPTLPHKRRDFRKKKLNAKCVLRFFYKFCLKHSRSTINVSYIGLHVNYPSFLSDFNEM
jgi:hypothetical protein